MNKFVLIFMFLSLASCSMNKLQSNIEDSNNDGLADETLLRFSSERIHKLYSSKDLKLSALAKCHSGSIKKGLFALKKIFKKYKKDHDYWNKVGTCYYLGNNTIKAEFYFNYSLSVSKGINVKNPKAVNNLGVIYLKNRHYERAYEMFTKTKKLSPSLLTPDFNLAQLNIQFGHVEKAEKILRNLLKSNSTDIDILASMATLKMIKKEYKSSEAYFKKIDKSYLRRADISNHYSLVLYKLGKYKKAYRILKAQKVSIIKPVVKMRKQLTIMIKMALEKERQTNLNNKKRG